MPILRDKYTWIPLYILISIILVIKYKYRGLVIIIATVLTVAATDQISSSLIKPLVHRLRPCKLPDLVQNMHLLVNCGSGFSFVSSHAANHFGIAVFLGLSLNSKFNWILSIGLIWAAFISFAQIYVGVHFPVDILGGALLGISIGIIFATLVKRFKLFRDSKLEPL